MRSKTAVFLSAVSLLSSLLTREAAAEPESKRLLYLLEDAKHEQWCAFSKESAWKTEVNSLSATTVATVEYLNGRISTIKVAKESEAGDWIVYDDYFLDQSGAIRNLNRTINSLPGDLKVKEVFVIEDGKAKKQSTTNLSLSTGKPVTPVKDWLPDPPVRTNVRAFPFSSLIGGKRLAKIWHSGKVCAPVRAPDHDDH